MVESTGQSLEEILRRFEAAWLNGQSPEIDAYLSASHPRRMALLRELVSIDMECRWRSWAQQDSQVETQMIAKIATHAESRADDAIPRQPLLDDYAARFPELKPVETLPLEMIAEEYRVRCRWGMRPSHQDYRRRFVDRADEVCRSLTGMDDVLSSEHPDASGTPETEDLLSGLTREELIQRLTESGIVTPDEIATVVSDRDTDSAEPVARALVTAGILTPYQLAEIAADRGRDLTLSQYVLLKPIGEGGMGRVFRARHRRMNRIVALKVINESIVNSPEAVERFHREVAAAATLTHPNVVTSYDANSDKGTHFLVMEHIDGLDLGGAVREGGPLPVDVALDHILQTARGLQFAHQKGIVHRDIKPNNLILDQSGTVKILDLGLARVETGAVHQGDLTGSGRIMGTIDFIAPEQAIDAKSADARSDIYSLGATLHFLLTGKPILTGETIGQKLRTLLADDVDLLDETLVSSIPDAALSILKRMVARRPEERFQHVSEVIDALEGIDAAQSDSIGRESRRTSDSGPAAGPAPVTIVAPSSQIRRTKPALSPRGIRWAAAAAAVALVGWGAWLASSVSVRVETDDGTLVVESDIPFATATVDGESVEVAYTEDGKTLTFSVDPGSHEIVVTSPDGLRLNTGSDHVEIQSGETNTLTARLERSSDLAHTVPPGDPNGPAGLVASGRPTRSSGAEQCHLVRFLPDGNVLIVYHDRPPFIWDPRTQLTVRSIELSEDTTGAALSPDGRRLAVTTTTNRLQLWDVETGTLARDLREAWQDAPGLQSNVLAFSADGRRLAMGQGSGTSPFQLEVLDVETGATLHRRPAPSRTCDVFFEPEGRWVISSHVNIVEQWDLTTGAVRSFDSPAMVASLSRNGSHVLASGFDGKHGTVQLTDLKSGAVTQLSLGRQQTRLALCQDARLAFLATTAGSVELWDLRSLSKVAQFDAPGQFASVAAVSSDERFAVTTDSTGTVNVWRLPKVDADNQDNADRYEQLAQGEWKPLIETPEFLDEFESVEWNAGGVEVQQGAHVTVPVDAKNMVFRTRFDHAPTRAEIHLRSTPEQSLTLHTAGERFFWLSERNENGVVNDASYHSPRPYSGPIDLAIVARNQKVAVYVNGQPVIRILVSTENSGAIRLESLGNTVRFENPELIVLDTP